MTQIQLERPREIQSLKPVRIVLVGGFLGAGKTTAIAALANHYIQRGLRVGIITNDQAPNLVDTAIMQTLNVPVGEVAGGCFCCRFTDLLDAAQAIFDRKQPDILLCEPVGSCTDMAATVLNPLKSFYRNTFSFAPFTVLADPHRLKEALDAESSSLFSPEVLYIFRKQLEEADVIAINKADLLMEAERKRLAQQLSERYDRPVLAVSALQGIGTEAWAERLLWDAPAGEYSLQDLNYDTYAQGEAVLGWLNAAAHLTGKPEFDGAGFLQRLLTEMRDQCQHNNTEIAHLKASLQSEEGLLRAHLTQMDGSPQLAGATRLPLHTAILTLNARIHASPEWLQEIVETALDAVSQAKSVAVEVAEIQSFSPGYPRPPYRIAEPV